MGWRYETRDDKQTKVPINPHNGRRAKSNDPRTWADHETAAGAVERYELDGVGFMFCADDPLAGVDLDDCRDPETGAIEAWALSIIDRLPTYWEVSPSGTGLKAWLIGELHAPRHKWYVGDGSVESYDHERFFTWTGEQLPNTPLELGQLQGELDGLVDDLEELRADKAVLKRLRPKAKCERLLAGDLSDYSDDHSVADLVLVGAIARAVKGDRVAIDRIFRRTVLKREKWDEVHGGDGRTYGEMTIEKALEGLVKTSGKESQKDILLALASDMRFVHTPQGEAFAVVFVDGHEELLRIGAKPFEHLLRAEFYESEGTAPAASAVRDAVATLEARARYEGEEREIGVRVMGGSDHAYLDLGDPLWRAVEVTQAGWKVIPNPLCFRRGKAMLSLPMPEAGGSLRDLRPFLNLDGEDAFILVLAWLVAALRPRGPYPVLMITGEQGSAKSVNSRILRSLIDPAVAALKSMPTSDRDLMIAAGGNWVLAYDNLSGITPATSDALCRLATGGGLSTRELYTDNEEVIFDATRPVMVNGIDDLTGRADLVSRSLGITLPPIARGQRRTEAALMREFEAARPKILGALLDAVACALRRLPDTVLKDAPRMADFATWVVAAEPALPWEPGRFLEAYEANRKALDDLALDLDRTATIIMEIMVNRDVWTGTATELLRLVREVAGEQKRGLPETPRKMSDRLKRAAPLLRQKGIDVQWRKGQHRTIIITNVNGPQDRIKVRDGSRTRE